jgi:CheY-like chemotaxis protein
LLHIQTWSGTVAGDIGFSPRGRKKGAVTDLKEKTVILVVDDDADSRETLAELLASRGYAVESAENGRQALEYLSCSKPALIILDLMMPVMSGWEFLERQRIDPRLQPLPVVVMTASGLVHDIKANAVIQKPVDFGALMNAVDRALDPGHSRPQ